MRQPRLATLTKTRSELVAVPPKSPLAKCAKFSIDSPLSEPVFSGTTGRVVKIPFGASNSSATPANIPPSAAVQRTDPTKSVVLEPGNISSMNRETWPSATKSPIAVSITSPPCIR